MIRQNLISYHFVICWLLAFRNMTFKSSHTLKQWLSKPTHYYYQENSITSNSLDYGKYYSQENHKDCCTKEERQDLWEYSVPCRKSILWIILPKNVHYHILHSCGYCLVYVQAALVVVNIYQQQDLQIEAAQ